MEDPRPENLENELIEELETFTFPWIVSVPLKFEALITPDFSGTLESVINVQWGDAVFQITKEFNPCPKLASTPSASDIDLAPVFYDQQGAPIPSSMYDEQRSQPLPNTYVFTATIPQGPIGPPNKVGITIVVQEIVVPVDDTP